MFPSVGKDVLCVLVLAGVLFFAGCAKMVTKPVKIVVGITLKPAKIVTDATVDLSRSLFARPWMWRDQRSQVVC